MLGFFTGYLSTQTAADAEAMARVGSDAIFRARPMAMTHTILKHLDRRDRIILLLLNGSRTVQEVARLTHRSELEIAQTQVRLLKRGYIEFLGAPDTERLPTNRQG